MFSLCKVKKIVFKDIKNVSIKFEDSNKSIKKNKKVLSLFNKSFLGNTLTLKNKSKEIKSEPLIISIKDIEQIEFINCNLRITPSDREDRHPKMLARNSSINIKNYFKNELDLKLYNSRVFLTKNSFILKLFLEVSEKSEMLFSFSYIDDATIFIDSVKDGEQSIVRFFRNAICRSVNVGLNNHSLCVVNVAELFKYTMYKKNNLVLNGDPVIENYSSFKNEKITKELNNVYPSAIPAKGKYSNLSFNKLKLRDLNKVEIESAFKNSIKQKSLVNPESLELYLTSRDEAWALYIQEKKERELQKLKNQIILKDLDVNATESFDDFEKDDLEKEKVIIDFILDLLSKESPTDYIDSGNREKITNDFKLFLNKKINLSEIQNLNKKKLSYLFDLKDYRNDVIF